MYLKLVCSRAFRETKALWTPQRTMIAVTSPVLTAILRGIASSWNWHDITVTAWLTAIAVAILWGITFLYEFVRAPALLYRAQQVQTGEQENTTRRLQDIRRDKVRAAIEKHGPNAVSVLLHLCVSGPMTFEPGGATPNLPVGIDKAGTLDLLRRRFAERQV